MAITGWTIDDYLERAAAVVTGDGFLIVAWGYLDVVAATDGEEHVFGSYNATNSFNHSRSFLRFGTNGPINAISRTTANATALATADPPEDTWFPMAAAFISATSRSAYSGAGNKGTNATNRAPNAPTHTRVGARCINTTARRPWQTAGALGEISVWDISAMSATEIDDTYQKVRTLDPTNAPNPMAVNAEAGQPWTGKIRAYWPLGTVGDLTDHSGNGHHLTQVGTALSTFGSNPPVDAEGDVVSPASAVLTLSTDLISAIVYPAVAVLALTAPDPVVGTGIIVTPDSAVLTLTALDPQPVIVAEPPSAILALTTTDPSVFLSVSPPSAVLTLTSQIEVFRYHLFELTVPSTTSFTNKFTDVEIFLEVTTPTEGVKTLRGFYDGDGAGGQTGNIWKCRYQPRELGVHTWTTASTDSQLDGKTGTFSCVAGPTGNPYLEHGPVHRHATFPHAVAHHDGTPFFWNGDSEWFFLTHVTSLIDDADRTAAIDFLQTHKVNNLLITLVNNDDGFFSWPWPGTSSPTNRTSFDLARMRQWEATFEYMLSKGIIADLYVYSDDSQTILPTALGSEEDLLYRYLIARFAAYSNITWNLALEYAEYRTAAWVENRAALVKNENSDVFLAVHQTPGDPYDFPGNTDLDHTSLQRFTTHDVLNAAIILNRDLTATEGRPIPIFHEEYAIEGANNPDPVVQRKDAWAIVTGGGFIKGASLGFWIGTPYASGMHFGYQEILYDTITKCAWWSMGPRNDLVSSGGTGRFCLGRVGTVNGELLIYSVAGASFTVDLTDFAGTCTAEWTNPLTGATSADSFVGGAPRTATNPFGSGEAALQITGDTIPDITVLPPSAILHMLAGGNQAPNAISDETSTGAQQPVACQLVYEDPDGPGPYTFEIVDQPVGGVLSGTGNDRTYTPNAGFSGSDTFTWRVNDGDLDSNIATWTINVAAVLIAPPAVLSMNSDPLIPPGELEVDDLSVPRFAAVVNKNAAVLSSTFTPAAGQLIVLNVNVDANSVGQCPVTVSGGGLTWAPGPSHVASPLLVTTSIYTAIGTGSPMQITITRNNAGATSTRISAKPYLVTGHHPTAYIGASATGDWDSNNKTLSLITTAVGRLFGNGTDNSTGGQPTSTDIADVAFYSGQIAAISCYKVSDHTGGITNGLNFDAAGATTPTSSGIAILEILADTSGGGDVVTHDSAILTLTAANPGAAQIVHPESAILSLTADNPTVAGADIVTPASAVLTLTADNPGAAQRVTHDSAILALAADEPSAEQTVTATSGILTLAADDPGAEQAVTPADAVLALSADNPSVSGAVAVEAPSAVLDLVGTDPFGPITVTPAAAILALSATDPQAQVAVDADTAILTLTAPQAGIAQAVAPTSAVLDLVASDPFGPATVTPDTAVLALTSDLLGSLVTPGSAAMSLVAENPSAAQAVAAPSAVLTWTAGFDVIFDETVTSEWTAPDGPMEWTPSVDLPNEWT